MASGPFRRFSASFSSPKRHTSCIRSLSPKLIRNRESVSLGEAIRRIDSIRCAKPSGLTRSLCCRSNRAVFFFYPLIPGIPALNQWFVARSGVPRSSANPSASRTTSAIVASPLPSERTTVSPDAVRNRAAPDSPGTSPVRKTLPYASRSPRCQRRTSSGPGAPPAIAIAIDEQTVLASGGVHPCRRVTMIAGFQRG